MRGLGLVLQLSGWLCYLRLSPFIITRTSNLVPFRSTILYCTVYGYHTIVGGLPSLQIERPEPPELISRLYDPILTKAPWSANHPLAVCFLIASQVRLASAAWRVSCFVRCCMYCLPRSTVLCSILDMGVGLTVLFSFPSPGIGLCILDSFWKASLQVRMPLPKECWQLLALLDLPRLCSETVGKNL
jgi:hypothetical protein